MIVTAKTAPEKRHKGISAFIVEKGFPGIIVGREEDKMGLRASDTTDLIFENCQVPVENILGEEGEGFKIAMTALDGGRIGIAAQSLGVAQAAFDAAVKYAKSRKDGYLGSTMYEHGLATLALSEMWGMTKGDTDDEDIQKALEAAVGVILRSQNVGGG